MQKFLQWYHKSTRNKVILFSIIFTIALGYSFLHRPLGLIMWYRFSFAEENKQIKVAINYVSDEKEFLESYKQYDIAGKLHKSQKELFKYIDDFEIDLLASSFVGLSEWYLQSFLSKSETHSEYFNLYIAYQEYHKNTYMPENINMFMEFLDKNQKISFFIDRLALKDEDFERYMFQQNAILIMFIFPYIYFLSGEQVCALPNKESILKNLTNFYESTNIKENEKKNFDTMQSLIKDKLNECQ